jgi:aspartokinase-like uncharacterized kinase
VIVVKVGGSLFDLPDLGGRLRAFLLELGDPDWLVVPGGGAVADVVRNFARNQGLDDEQSHWLALRSCSLNAHFLRELLPNAALLADPTVCRGPSILDSYAFIRADEGQPGCLPHSWDATSDSVAVRAAVVACASLVLLKSVTIPEDQGWDEVARAGYVDALLPALLLHLSAPVRVVNLRTWPLRSP